MHAVRVCNRCQCRRVPLTRTSPVCETCARERRRAYQRQYDLSNGRLQYYRDYHAAHREKRAARAKERNARPEVRVRKTAYESAWRARNRDALRVHRALGIPVVEARRQLALAAAREAARHA